MRGKLFIYHESFTCVVFVVSVMLRLRATSSRHATVPFIVLAVEMGFKV